MNKKHNPGEIFFSNRKKTKGNISIKNKNKNIYFVKKVMASRGL